jgi:hypothetical protein
MKDWQDATDAFEEKASALRKEGRELLRLNTRYCKAATSLKVELDEYAKRLDERADLLKKRSLRFCEIMQELRMSCLRPKTFMRQPGKTANLRLLQQAS